MDLSICDDEEINIYIPVTLGEETKGLHDDFLNYAMIYLIQMILFTKIYAPLYIY
jgi:hypothetical protein